jgi:hypothetical protein
MDGNGPGFTVTLAEAPNAAPAFWTDASDWAEADLPPRRWLAPGFLLRGALTVLVGSPGASKSTLALAWGAALALGESFGRLSPMDEEGAGRRKRVLVINAEDDDCEQRRRLSALLRQFGRVSRDLAGWLMRAGPNLAGTLVEKDALGLIRASAGLSSLEEIITSFRPDVLILDPLIELFAGIDENANADVSAGLSILRALATRHQMAILLLHHVRKGAVMPGDMDSARGASSLHGKVRVGLTLTAMTEDEAVQLGISADARRHYLRLDDGKNSYAELAGAQWFERSTIELDNGDTAPTLIPWTPPKDTITPEIRHQIEAGIAAGSGDGPWSPTLSPKPRSVRHLLHRAGVTTADGRRKLLADLAAAGFDLDAKFKDARSRKIVSGIRSPAGKPIADWLKDGPSD